MGQMTAEVVGLSLFLLPAFCAAVTAVDSVRRQNFTGHSSPSFTSSINNQVSLIGSKEIKLNYYIYPRS